MKILKLIRFTTVVLYKDGSKGEERGARYYIIKKSRGSKAIYFSKSNSNCDI